GGHAPPPAREPFERDARRAGAPGAGARAGGSLRAVAADRGVRTVAPLRFTERHVRVLHAVAEGYIRTAHPVPSQHVASRLDVSSATVRNDFGMLEEGGLLQQPHPSAGPTHPPQCSRSYATASTTPRRLPRGERASIAPEPTCPAAQHLYAAASRLAARLSGYAVLVRLPPDDALRVPEVHLSLV